MSESLDVRADQATDGRGGARGRWALHVVVPARGATGKTRLRVPASVDHALLTRALALDTVDAALRARGVRAVAVVTGDAALASALPRGVRAVAEPTGPYAPDPRGAAGHGAEPRLVAAVRAGLRACPAQAPAAVLLGDLPALRPRELDEALAAAQEAIERPAGAGRRAARAAFVPDASGAGTVLLVGATPAALVPAFGRGSAAAHERGATRLAGAWPGLRTDVDTAEDLVEALALGVGAHTARALRNAVIGAPGPPGHADHVR